MIMISRISLSLFVVLGIIIPVNAFLTRGMGLVRFKAVDSITRSSISTSDDSNLQWEDEIKGLKEDIQVLKIKREELLPSDPLYLAFTEEMTAIRKYITALFQQGLATTQGEKVVQEVPPSPRKGRWDALNQCLEANKYPKDRANGEVSTSYSAVKYNEVKGVFGPLLHDYIQVVKALPDAKFEFLSQLLAMTSTILGSIDDGNEAHRLHLIFPILLVVCTQFDGQVQIKVEEELTGKNVKANGRFEFMLQRGDKRVCIVEAKKDDMDQGRAQCLIGCEVASDLDDLRIVYGIVTTFESWTFLKSCDDKIERDRTTLLVREGVVDSASLKEIAGKIYAMLSDD